MKEIPLTRGKVAIVDDGDFGHLSQWKWYLGGRGYAARKENGKTVLMHRVILGLTERSTHCDHKNQDRLDNRRENIRPCDATGNNANKRKQAGPATSVFKGVRWQAKNKKWWARISVKRNRMSLGLHHTEVDAARAYNAAAVKHFGEFACLNPV